MARMILNDEMWEQIKALFPSRPKGGRYGTNDRMFIEAVFWIARTGAPWRDLPKDFGSWNTVYNRFHRWCERGDMEKILEAFKKRWRSRMAHD